MDNVQMDNAQILALEPNIRAAFRRYVKPHMRHGYFRHGMDEDDVLQELRMAAFLAFKKFDETKGEYYSFMKTVIDRKAIGLLRRSTQPCRFSKAEHIVDNNLFYGDYDEL